MSEPTMRFEVEIVDGLMLAPNACSVCRKWFLPYMAAIPIEQADDYCLGHEHDECEASLAAALHRAETAERELDALREAAGEVARRHVRADGGTARAAEGRCHWCNRAWPCADAITARASLAPTEPLASITTERDALREQGELQDSYVRALEATKRELLAVLDDIEASVRVSDFDRLAKCAFVWSQRRDHILDGEETWEDQRIGPLRFPGAALAPTEVDEKGERDG